MTRTSFSFLALAAPAPLLAAEAPALAAAPDAGYFVRLVAGLLLVLAVLGGLTWASRRLGLNRLAGAGGDRLRVLATLSVGTRERLLLVRVGDDEVLLGVTQHGISRLHQRPAPDGDGAPAPFSERLRQAAAPREE